MNGTWIIMITQTMCVTSRTFYDIVAKVTMLCAVETNLFLAIFASKFDASYALGVTINRK